MDEIRFIKFFIISFPVIFERFFLRVREPREEKRREEKREENEDAFVLVKERAEDLKKKKSGKRKDNRSPLVCLSLLSSQKVLKSQNNKNLSLFLLSAEQQKQNRTHTKN